MLFGVGSFHCSIQSYSFSVHDVFSTPSRWWMGYFSLQPAGRQMLLRFTAVRWCCPLDSTCLPAGLFFASFLQEAVIGRLCELLLEYLHSQSHLLSFPELVVPMMIQVSGVCWSLPPKAATGMWYWLVQVLMTMGMMSCPARLEFLQQAHRGGLLSRFLVLFLSSVHSNHHSLVNVCNFMDIIL